MESLDRSLTAIANGEVETAIAHAMTRLESRIAEAIASDDVEALLAAEAEARRALAAARSAVTVSLPRGVALSTAARRDWTAYQTELLRLEESVLAPTAVKMATAVDQAADVIGARVDRRRRVESVIADATARGQQHMRTAVRQLDESMSDLNARVDAFRRELQQSVATATQTARQKSESTDYSALSEEELIDLSLSLEEATRLAADRAASALESVTAQIREIVWETDETGQVVTAADLAASAEEEIMALRERAEQDLEMAQLGMAVSVIDHEFQSTIRSIRSSLRRLRAWSDQNPQLSSVYSELRTSFDHLDGYLTLFTPLQRRLRRTKTEVRGSELAAFLRNLFGDRLRREDIELVVTSEFTHSSVLGFTSTFYPVFVNLVDNATFWLSDTTRARVIRLDAQNDDFLVSDTGPGVPLRDREAIFETGFTRKPGGRGLGLSISRQALRAAGYDLIIDSEGQLGGATFRISRLDEEGR